MRSIVGFNTSLTPGIANTLSNSWLSVGIKGLTIRATLRIAAQSLPRYPRYAGAAMGPMTKLDEGQRDGIKDEQCAYDATDGPSQIAQRVSFIHRRPSWRQTAGLALRWTLR
jgi:hypothetical protein